MSCIRTVIVRANPRDQLRGGKQSIGLDYGTLAMHPFGFDGIEPGTLPGPKQGKHMSPFARSLDLFVVLTHPGAHGLA